MSATASSPHLVSPADLERCLDALRMQAPAPLAGLFGPDSKLWEVNREAVLFLGGARAALLQLAHPFVASAIAEHSTTETDPWGRFRRTFRNVFAMVYGDLDSAFASARRVHRVHQHITGCLTEDLGVHRAGDRYEANDPDALSWVHATLWDTSVLVFERVVRPLGSDEKESYYLETRRFAALFGIEDECLPPTWTAFEQYNREQWESDRLAVGSAARETAGFLLRGRSPFSAPVMAWLRVMTAGLMPDRLRRDFGLPWGSRQRRIFEGSIAALHAAHRVLPRRLRFVPPYLAALRRLRGDGGRDRVGDALTRLWLGA